MTRTPVLVPVADCGVLVVFADDISDETRARIHALDAALASNPPVGLTEIVPAMTTLLVLFDPLATDHTTISAAVHENLTAETETSIGVGHVIEVCYDAAHAPNLSALAARSGLDTETAVSAHLAGRYTVGMYGFAPGFAYMYGTPPVIQQPRNPTPGPVVPAGSVIIAGQQCLIIPVAMSTGWFAIGRSSASVFTADGDRPFLFDVGDTVTFRRIDVSTLDSQLAERNQSAR